MPEYNGHKNWNHWNVSLWLTGTESSYKRMLHFLKTSKNRHEAARKMLRVLPETTPDGAPYNVTNVKAALRGLE